MKTNKMKKTKTLSINNCNKMIAEFMGEKIDLDRFGENWKRVLSLYITDNTPQYHTSWDWLIPVVKKIHTYTAFNWYLGYRIEIDRALSNTDIDKLWIEVVRFIKKYNLEKKKFNKGK